LVGLPVFPDAPARAVIQPVVIGILVTPNILPMAKDELPTWTSLAWQRFAGVLD
jgi:hypothetical protein